MPDVWLPGAHRDYGANAGYNSGRSQMLRAVAHYTVGADSRGVAKRGYFHFLIHRDASRENGCTQYAEIDAVTWHAADAGNRYGPGIEYERLTTGGTNDEGLSNAQPLTENQIAWGGRIVAFCAEWGIPATLWDGPRYGAPIMPGGGYRGWVNHHDLDPSRSDGLTNAEWSAVTGGAPPDDNRRRDVIYREENGQYWEMGFGDYVLVPEAVGIGAALNGAAVVPIKTPERIAMGIAASEQAKKFLKGVGLIH